MIKSEFEKEIEAAFELAYTPVMLVKQRLNGQDFLETAVPLLDQIRDQFGDNSDKVKARRVIERIKQLTTELELIRKNRRE